MHGVGFELVVAAEAFVEADDALGFALGHGANQFKRQLALEADEKQAVRGAVNFLARQRQRFHRRGERVAAFDQDFVQNVIIRAAFANVTDVQLELLLQRRGVAGFDVRMPCFEIGFRQLEDFEAEITFLRSFRIAKLKLRCFSLSLFDLASAFE